MFYPVESLRRGGRFYLCWVADSWPLRFATITHRQLWSQDIRKICDDLLEVMKNESGRPKNRFSLRLSSQLLRGLVRLYQRKVTVFVGDLCMINALVMKSTNKKLLETSAQHTVVERPELPRLVFEEQVEDERVEERIWNSGNVVAHVQDITLKEPTLPENRLLLDDGFGELNQDPVAMLADRTIEMMLVQETSAQYSGLDLPNVSDKSHDKSRLHDTVQMEAIPEVDISVFRKSMGAELVPELDVEKEIPEIPEIPIPELPAPQTNNQSKEQEPEVTIEGQTKDHAGNAKEKPAEEIVLEELEEEPQIKRRKRNKLIIDQKIELSSNYLRSRIDNINVELRCEDSIDDVIHTYATPNILLNRPAHCGTSLHSNIGYKLSLMFARNLGTGMRSPAAHREFEEVIAPRTRRSQMRVSLEKIDEAVEPTDKTTEPQQEQNVSKQMDITDTNIQSIIEEPQEGQELMDISILPTQRVLTVSQQKRMSENEPSPKRQRRSGFVSYRSSQQLAIEMSSLEANKENVPDLENRQADTDRITAMLHEAGLADINELERQTVIEPTNQVTVTQKSVRNGSDSETPLGSLDRTKVSLGDSEITTDSKRFIRSEWGTQGTMHKIYASLRRGASPLDVRRLVARGPALPSHRRLVAARCFTSILKLKQHGFIQVLKDPTTYEIKDILLGSRIVM